jgi:hypothetical protein
MINGLMMKISDPNRNNYGGMKMMVKEQKW